MESSRSGDLGLGSFHDGEHPHYAYKVVEVRSKMIGDKMSGQELEHLLNSYGAQGWQLKAITSTDVKGRLGPGGVEGLLVTFEWNPRAGLAVG